MKTAVHIALIVALYALAGSLEYHDAVMGY